MASFKNGRFCDEQNKIYLKITPFMITSKKEQRELAHNKVILENSEKVWGRSGLAGERRLKRRADMIIDWCNINSSKRVLEIGCGTGTLTEILADTSAEVVATDIFPEFLDVVRKKINNAPNVSLQLADAQMLAGLPKQSFDVVCGLSILHHLDIKFTLKNILRVLKPGGCIAFSEPNMLNPQIAIQKNIPFIKKMLGDSPDETAFFKWQMKSLLKKSGFTEISVEPFDFLHPMMPDFSAKFVDALGKVLEGVPLVRDIAGSLFIYAKKHD